MRITLIELKISTASYTAKKFKMLQRETKMSRVNEVNGENLQDPQSKILATPMLCVHFGILHSVTL